MKQPQVCGWNLCELIVNLRAEGGTVNPPIVVQWVYGYKAGPTNLFAKPASPRSRCEQRFQKI
jgi:hypothetical protein